jgi:hypothetical protein
VIGRKPMVRMICHHGGMLWARVVRTAVAVCLVAGFAGCTSDEPSASDGPRIEVATMRGSLLQAADVGPTWSAPKEPPPANVLVRFCAGDAAVPPMPTGAEVVSSPLVDEGQEGAQTLSQFALVYPDAAGAAAGLATLRAVADGCPPSVSVPAKVNGDRQEPAYTETAATMPLDEGGWKGFVIERHKLYDPTRPSTADTAVAVAAKRNVLIVDSYAVYRLGAASASPQFAADWRKLVGTVLARVKG